MSGREGCVAAEAGSGAVQCEKKKHALHLVEAQAPCAEVQLCYAQQQPSGES